MQNYEIVRDVSADIFRAYDIRGIADKDLTLDSVYTIGMVIGSEAQKRGDHAVIIGRDGRVSGPKLLAALSAGLCASGCDVINIGEVTTPMVYYATNTLGTHSGVALSGSHNPPEYNGLKIVLASETLSGQQILDLRTRIMQQDFCFGDGKEEQASIIDDYITEVTSRVKLTRPLKIVVDCGNGVGGKIAPLLLRKLGCEVSELYCEVDGNFPHHQPDPAVPENLKDLIIAVKKQHADVGLAFDGDADRVGVVQEARRARFVEEAGGRVLVGHQVRVDDLDRDRAVQDLLLGPVDLPHAPDADEVEDADASRQEPPDHRIRNGGCVALHGQPAAGAKPMVDPHRGATVLTSRGGRGVVHTRRDSRGRGCRHCERLETGRQPLPWRPFQPPTA